MILSLLNPILLQWDPFKKLIDTIAEQQKISFGDIMLSLNDATIRPSDTPNSVNLKSADTIGGYRFWYSFIYTLPYMSYLPFCLPSHFVLVFQWCTKTQEKTLVMRIVQIYQGLSWLFKAETPRRNWSLKLIQ